MSGGDWLTFGDTQAQACYKLGKIDAMLRARFPRYYHTIGNHDTNYQGDGALTDDTIRNLWYRDEGSAYYSFKGLSSTCYVMDVGQDGDANTMNTRRWEQIDWLASKLSADDARHSVIFKHFHYYSAGNVSALSVNLGLLCAAYNARGSVTLNGITYNFADKTGKVEFMMAGHMHQDFVTTLNGIPVIGTTNFTNDNVPTYDLVLADYDDRKVHLVRVGTGSDRTVNLA